MYPIIKFIDIARVSLGGGTAFAPPWICCFTCYIIYMLGYAVLHVTLYICLDMLFYIIKALMTQ